MVETKEELVEQNNRLKYCIGYVEGLIRLQGRHKHHLDRKASYEKEIHENDLKIVKLDKELKKSEGIH